MRSGTTGAAVARFRRRRYFTKFDLDECQRRVWLLAGCPSELPPHESRHGPISTFVFARADERGFSLSFTSFGGGHPVYGPSDFLVRGQWRSIPEGTVIETWLAPRRTFIVMAAGSIGGLTLLALLPSLSPRLQRDVIGDEGRWLLIGACFLWLLVMTIEAMVSARDDGLRNVPVRRLHAVAFPPGADPAHLPAYEPPPPTTTTRRFPRRRAKVITRGSRPPLRG
jgi:hypothetical protein